MIDLVEIGRTSTDAAGSFIISGNPSELPTEENGAVALELDTVDAPNDQAFVYSFFAHPPAPGSPTWTVELPTTPVFQVGVGLVERPSQLAPALRTRRFTKNSSPRTAYDPAAGATWLTAPSGETGFDTETFRDDSGGELGTGDYYVDGEGGTTCPEGYGPIGWLSQKVYRYNYVPTKYFRTRGHAKFKWVIARSNETYMEVAINVDGVKYGLGGGFLWSSDHEETLTYKPTADYNQQRVWKVKWEYQRERKFCHEDLGWGHIWLLDVWRWVPNRPEAGNVWEPTSWSFDCGGTGPNYVDLVAEDVVVAKNTDVRFGGWFSIIGVKLDAAQKDREEQKFWILPKNGDTAKICGDDDTPAYANLVKEMTQ